MSERCGKRGLGWMRDRWWLPAGRAPTDRGLSADVRAVSSVVGGLLFIAIVMVALINFRVAVVPMLDEQREGNHMNQVGEAFAAIKGEADRQVDGRSRAPVSTSVPLKPQQDGGLTTDGTMASFLVFDPDVRSVKMDTNELLIQIDDENAVFGTEETWSNITGNEEIVNVTQVQHLRVRITDPEAHGDGDNVSVTLRDANGQFAGDLSVYVMTHSSDYSVKVRVRDADYDVLYDQGESAFQQNAPPFYWVDALADEVQFADVIRAAEGPINMTFAKNGMDGAFTAVFYEDSAVGPVLVGSVGKLFEDWSREDVGGVLRYESQNVRFIRQDLYFESGGIVVDQPVGNTFFVEPALDVEKSGNRTIIRVTTPVLAGSPAMHSGYQSVPVRVQSLKDFHIEGTAPRFGFNVTTLHPSVWTAFWNAKFEGAGYSEALGHFVVDNGTDWASFVFYGNTVDPDSTVHDLSLQVHMGRVDIIMRGG